MQFANWNTVEWIALNTIHSTVFQFVFNAISNYDKTEWITLDTISNWKKVDRITFDTIPNWDKVE